MIGRKEELYQLRKLYNSQEAELVAIYGRRRVGKTYLVNEVFSNEITFQHAGMSPIEANNRLKKEQLKGFYTSLKMHGAKVKRMPKDWQDAFYMLECYLRDCDTGNRQLVFLDELPWMDTKNSGFLIAFEHFWNNWGCHRKNLMVIVCGSANSWILDNLIDNRDGLYGRLTGIIKLSPFTLHECEEYFQSMQFVLSRYDIVQSYMVVGGIPYYMRNYDNRKSLAQNIDRLFFGKDALLRIEYDRLFSSIFSSPEEMKRIVELLSQRSAGFTRKEISEKTGISNGGELTKKLNALVASDFVLCYVPFGVKGKTDHYKLVDPFCLFFLHFVKNHDKMDRNFWTNNQTHQEIVSWRGIAFENVCFNHIPQIKKALQIQGVASSESSWSKRSDDEEGTQIDMLIDRDDNVINVCEMKFYGEMFTVSKQYYMTLLKRQRILGELIPKKKSIRTTLITTMGLVPNNYSSIFTNVITMDDLFE